MVVPVKFANACAASDDIFLIATIPDGLPDGGEFTRLYYLNPSTEDVWHYRDWPNHEVVSVCLRRAREGLSRAGCALTGNETSNWRIPPISITKRSLAPDWQASAPLAI